MNLVQRFFTRGQAPKKSAPKGERPKKKRRTPAEIVKEEEAKHILRAKRVRPDLYNRMMDERTGLSEFDTGGEGGGGDLLKTVVGALVQGAAPLLLSNLPQQMGQPAVPVMPPATMVPAYATPPDTVTAPMPAPSVEVADDARFYLDGLGNGSKTPGEAADWLRAQTDPMSKTIVQIIVQTPDDDIPRVLDHLEKTRPTLAPVVAFLRRDPAWLVAALREVRAKSAA